MAKIVVTLKGKVLREIQLGEGTTRIGRDPSNEIHLENPAVSRFHAEIYRQGWPFYVEDKKSTNGTYLNGKFLNWKSALNNRDQITIGKHTLVFLEEAKDRGVKGGNGFDVGETICVRREDL